MRPAPCRRWTARTSKAAPSRSTRLRIAIAPVDVRGAARVATEPRLHQHMAIPRTGDLVNPAERLAREENERSEKRRHELAEQRSDLNPPEVRIRTWERIHQLRMPSDPAHPILDVIAVGTRLTLEEVQEEQRARAARAAHRT